MPAAGGQPWWFVILLVMNTVGVLEIVYLFWVLNVEIQGIV
jgi:hypothetical protein